MTDEEFSKQFHLQSTPLKKIQLAIREGRYTIWERYNPPNFSEEYLEPVLNLPDKTPVTRKAPRKSGGAWYMKKKVKKKVVNTKRLCPHCEDDSDVTQKKVSIIVGSESFMTTTMVCEKCGSYALTPKIRKEMDEWGRKFTKNVIEPQPIFSESTHRFAEEMANQHGLKKVPLFRALTAFYLNHVVNLEDFQEIKNYCDKHPSRKLLNKGERSKVSVPIRYLLYRKIQIFSDVWKVPHSKTIEEAVLFGLTALSSKEENFAKLKVIAESLEQFIADVAQAA